MVFMYLVICTHAILLAFLLFPFLTVLLAGLKKETIPPMTLEEDDFACIITAYQQVDIALPLVDSLLKQTHRKFHIYLVADECDVSDVQIQDIRVTVLRPETKLGSKVRSINHAIQHFVREHAYIVIFDPDNLAPDNFLSEINAYTQAGYPAVQGVRAAKNLDTLYACLDATGELYYNYSVRYTPWRLGASSTISGSGMAVKTSWFKQYLTLDSMDTQKHEVIVAEDKILQIDLIRRGARIAYAKKAIIYDEKVTSGYQVERQRTRWINSYFQHLPAALGLVWKGITTFNYNKFVFGLMISQLPMFLLVAIAALLGMMDLGAFLISGSSFYLMMLGLVVAGGVAFVLHFFLVLKLGKAPKAIWKSLWGIPFFIIKQLKGLVNMKQSNKDFMVTTHSKVVTLDEVDTKEK